MCLFFVVFVLVLMFVVCSGFEVVVLVVFVFIDLVVMLVVFVVVVVDYFIFFMCDEIGMYIDC